MPEKTVSRFRLLGREEGIGTHCRLTHKHRRYTDQREPIDTFFVIIVVVVIVIMFNFFFFFRRTFLHIKTHTKSRSPRGAITILCRWSVLLICPRLWRHETQKWTAPAHAEDTRAQFDLLIWFSIHTHTHTLSFCVSLNAHLLLTILSVDNKQYTLFSNFHSSAYSLFSLSLFRSRSLFPTLLFPRFFVGSSFPVFCLFPRKRSDMHALKAYICR